ncbi:MAG: hypothetical protein ACK4ND_19900 [Cytophagaceae bacterium]
MNKLEQIMKHTPSVPSYCIGNLSALHSEEIICESNACKQSRLDGNYL